MAWPTTPYRFTRRTNAPGVLETTDTSEVYASHINELQAAIEVVSDVVAAAPRFLSGVSTFTGGTIAPLGSLVITIPVIGALEGDPVLAGYFPVIPAALIKDLQVTANDTVTLTLTNPLATPVTVSAAAVAVNVIMR